MKKLFTLLLIAATVFSFSSKAQTTATCNADFNFSISNFTVQFTPVMTGETATTNHYWSFGDGNVVSSVTASHTYAAAGSYSVKHYIIKHNANGGVVCSDSVTKIVLIQQTNVCNLQAYFTWHADSSSWNTIHFENQSTPHEIGDSIRWNFGDGTPPINGTVGNLSLPTHVYANAGTYNVCIRVKKNNNTTSAPCVSEICKTVVVQAPPCNLQVSFSMHRDSLNPRKVNFTNLTIATNAAAIAKWSFGDGTTANTWNAVHEYTQPGTYRVCLMVQVTPNCVRESCDTIVIPPPPPSCNDLSKFRFEKFSNDNQKYKFTPDYIATDIVYTWTFGDGTGSHDAIATHRYAQAGTYTACLTAWRGPNCASTTCKTITVLPQVNCDSIHVIYTYQRDPFVPNKLYFYANANFPVLDQTWTITRISPASTVPPVILHQNNPVYVFHDTGYYRVCLKAITLGGCVKEYCSVIHIEHVVSNLCELQAFPNPATSLISVNVTLTQTGMIDAYVYNSTNILVKEKHQQGITGVNTVSLNINDLTPGLYTIKIQYNGKVCYARFTKL